ncbi:MAG: PH domain-containing protein [Prevotella sp.]
MNRTFQQQFNWQAKIAIFLTSGFAFYMFWQQKAIVGTLFALFALFIINYIINSNYTFKTINHQQFLEINHGRFYRKKTISLAQINKISTHKICFGLITSLIIETENKQYIGIQPQEPELFINEFYKRKNASYKNNEE